MRSAVVLLVLAVLFSGCIALARTEPLGDHEASAQPGASWYAPILDPSYRWQVRYDVSEASGRLQACVVNMPDQFRGFRLDPFFDGIGATDCLQLGDGNATSGTLHMEAKPGEQRALALDCLGDAPCRAKVHVEGKAASRGGEVALGIALLLLVILGVRILVDRLDRARIRDFVSEKGGRVRDISWQPFGRGWFGEKGERVYAVAFVDASGRKREATVKTSLFSGVWTDQLD